MEVLARLYQEEGAALLTDANRLTNMLRDLCPEGTRRQQTMLINALREGIPTALLFPSEPLHLLARRLAEKLEQGRLAFHRDDAAWVVDAWAGVLGKSSAIPLLATQGPGNSRPGFEPITEALGQEQKNRSLSAIQAGLQPAAIRSSNIVESPGFIPGSLPVADKKRTTGSSTVSFGWIKSAFYFMCYVVILFGGVLVSSGLVSSGWRWLGYGGFVFVAIACPWLIVKVHRIRKRLGVVLQKPLV